MKYKHRLRSDNIEDRRPDMTKKRQSAFSIPGEEYSTDSGLTFGQGVLTGYINQGRTERPKKRLPPKK